MKTAAILSLLIGSAVSFAPAQQKASSTALSAFESELGAQRPLGYWDPLNMLNGVDQERFDRLRYVEIKHGRKFYLFVILNKEIRCECKKYTATVDYISI